MTISWSPIVYNFSLPWHLKNPFYVFFPQENKRARVRTVDWGLHRAAILCNGVEVGSYAYNSRTSTAPLSYVHRPGAGHHVYSVRVENYAQLSYQSQECPIDVGGSSQTATPNAVIAPFNLRVDRTVPEAWQVGWSPRVPGVAGAQFVVVLDIRDVATSATAGAVVNGPVSGIPHAVRVDVRSADGATLASSLVYPVPSANPQPQPVLPAAPGAPLLRAVNRNEVILTWSTPASDTVLGLDLERDGVVIAHVPISGTYTDPWSGSAAPRTYRLRAVSNDDGRSGWSSALRVRLPTDDVPPGAITGVTVRDDEAGAVVVDWQPGPATDGIVSYIVYRDGAYLVTASGTPYRDLTAVGGQVHSYAIVAVDGSGNASALSATTEHRAPIRQPANPSAPTAYLVQRLQEASFPLAPNATGTHLSYAVEVSWEPQPGEGGTGSSVTAYRVYRDDQPVAEIPLSTLIWGQPLALEYGDHLSRAELQIRGNAYYDSKRRRNVWVDYKTPSLPGDPKFYGCAR